MQAVAKEFEHLNRMFQTAANQIAAVMKPAVEQAERARKILQAEFDRHAPAMLEANKHFKAAQKQIADHLTALDRQMAPILKELQHQFRELPARNREALRTLGQHGWYLDPELPASALYEIARALQGEDPASANAQLCDYFDSRLNQIDQSLREQLPRRAKLISAALSAHREGTFGLSIPVLLAQADGVCQDLTGAQLYSRKNGGLGPVLRSEDSSQLLDSLLTPLVEPMPINANSRERAGALSTLNRHAILHGEMIDYDTRVNSCRAISLLVFVAWALGSRRKRKKTDAAPSVDKT